MPITTCSGGKIQYQDILIFTYIYVALLKNGAVGHMRTVGLQINLSICAV